MTKDKAALDILLAARVRALSARPYFSPALCAIKLVEKAGIGTMACDQYWRVYYDPVTVKKWGVADTAVGLLHEVSHLLQRHHLRAQNLGVTKADHQVLNVAQDCAINGCLLHADDRGLALLATDPVPSKFKLPEGLAWEEYYGLLKAQQAKQPQDQPGQPGQGKGSKPSDGEPGEGQGGGGEGQGEPGGKPGSAAGKPGSAAGKGGDGKPSRECGSGATGVPQAWDDGAPVEGDDGSGTGGLNAVEAANIITQTADKTREAAKGQGRMPGGWLAWAGEVDAPAQVKWQTILQQRVRAAVRYVSGASDYTYARPSRRSAASPGIVLPAMRRPVVQIAAIVDTSGSMSGGDTAAALAEVKSICKIAGAPIRVLSVDAVVHTDQAHVTNVTNVKVRGGGGTSMNAGIRHVVATRRRQPVDVLIVLTDGGTDFPRREDVPRDLHLIYVMIGATAEYYRSQVPTWAQAVYVKKV